MLRGVPSVIAPQKLTLRLAYENYLRPDHTKPRTIEAYQTTVNHWECAKLSVAVGELRAVEYNPDLSQIDNVTLLDFKRHLSGKLSPNSVRKYLRHLAVVLHRIGPPDYRNPGGLALIDRVPYVQQPKEVRKKPRVIEDHELTALYQAAESATWPRCEVSPPLWWQSLIVTLFNLGLRRLDFLSALQEEFDLERGFVLFDAEKTGKVSALPLHPVVVDHLAKIWEPERVLVWPWRFNQRTPESINKKKTSLYAQWHRLREAAGIERVITPHDLRRTCGSDLFSVSPAAAAECLQHASIVTTQRSYANCSRETRDLMLAKEQPAIFGGEPPSPDDPMILRFPSVG